MGTEKAHAKRMRPDNYHPQRDLSRRKSPFLKYHASPFAQTDVIGNEGSPMNICRNLE